MTDICGSQACPKSKFYILYHLLQLGKKLQENIINRMSADHAAIIPENSPIAGRAVT